VKTGAWMLDTLRYSFVQYFVSRKSHLHSLASHYFDLKRRRRYMVNLDLLLLEYTRVAVLTNHRLLSKIDMFTFLFQTLAIFGLKILPKIRR
jgi:hypothetical protein